METYLEIDARRLFIDGGSNRDRRILMADPWPFDLPLGATHAGLGQVQADGPSAQSRIGHNPSFIWRSIYASQVLVKEALRWRVGDCSKVRIWDDPWLCDSNNAYITTPRPPTPHVSLVSDLLDDTHAKWNISLINTSFTPMDAKRILSIPRSLALDVDQMIWKLSRDGRYSVKSAYYYAMEHLVNFSHLKVDGNWNEIWSLKIPHKLKILLWRIARGCLPTRVRFCQRRVPCPETCPMCNGAPESEKHLFFECTSAQEV